MMAATSDANREKQARLCTCPTVVPESVSHDGDCLQRRADRLSCRNRQHCSKNSGPLNQACKENGPAKAETCNSFFLGFSCFGCPISPPA